MQTNERRPTPEDIPGQKLDYPASQREMTPQPDSDLSNYSPANKLSGKVAIITGGDSGIGRAVAIAYAMEGAEVAIFYNENDQDAQDTKKMVKEIGNKDCLVLKGDVRNYEDCQTAIQQVIDRFGKLNILVNNAAYQMTQQKFEDISLEQFRRTMETNVFGYFYMVKAALAHLQAGDVIINTGSIVGKMGKGMLVDYATSKGAVHTFTKSLALNLGDRGIRVNSVVPGPVWTPNIPATMPIDKVDNYDTDGILKRAAQPEELAPAYVFLASSDSSFVTGALYDVTGGQLAA
ncbi:3-oxoacyl-(acyl-carrier-protein) reductase [Stanieria cyanosphaera PCC 7437]|uniref:3-oxoacyl-(Acyl-carrier-protein) reductase n=1 Tax=Stanieria cyanosphaera (strain ATCC 29371 / PCC 7437) TaxID=111780 RepID=K9XMJ9_STAC7|nr:SDR family oxidoreductase [Stanieria cyanosphaera]AFZ33718.1 3-oxoacyl-(acyl-carrier-protein) reductase [Stanieria cyanosphaera PCC 7437]